MGGSGGGGGAVQGCGGFSVCAQGALGQGQQPLRKWGGTRSLRCRHISVLCLWAAGQSRCNHSKHVCTHTSTHLQPHTGANLHTFIRFAAATAGPDYKYSTGLTNISVNSCLSDSMSHSKHVVIGRTISTESSKSALLTKVVKQMRRVNICFQNVEEWSQNSTKSKCWCAALNPSVVL